MKVPLALLGLGLGLLVLPRQGSVLPGVNPFGPLPPPRPVVPPGSAPTIVVVPPLTIAPNGRHLTAREQASLAPFIFPGGLDAMDVSGTVLWWGAPASSFQAEDSGHTVIALTTARGIYLRGANHEIIRADELATLGHELVHVGQFRRGDNHTKTSAEMEVPAYQMGLGIREYLDKQAGLGEEYS